MLVFKINQANIFSDAGDTDFTKTKSVDIDYENVDDSWEGSPVDKTNGIYNSQNNITIIFFFNMCL